MRSFSIIVATSSTMGIGANGSLPWNLPSDMAFFKEKTSTVPERGPQSAEQGPQRGLRNAVIMGRRTWESIPARFRPLPRRLNIVVTRQSESASSDHVIYVSSFDAALRLLDQPELVGTIDQVFVIGGSQLYHAALPHPSCVGIYVTRILHPRFACDTFFPAIDPAQYHEVESSDIRTENGMDFQFVTLVRSTM